MILFSRALYLHYAFIKFQFQDYIIHCLKGKQEMDLFQSEWQIEIQDKYCGLWMSMESESLSSVNNVS